MVSLIVPVTVCCPCAKGCSARGPGDLDVSSIGSMGHVPAEEGVMGWMLMWHSHPGQKLVEVAPRSR